MWGIVAEPIVGRRASEPYLTQFNSAILTQTVSPPSSLYSSTGLTIFIQGWQEVEFYILGRTFRMSLKNHLVINRHRPTFIIEDTTNLIPSSIKI